MEQQNIKHIKYVMVSKQDKETCWHWRHLKKKFYLVLTSWLIYINQSDELNYSVRHNIVKIREIYFQMIDR